MSDPALLQTQAEEQALPRHERLALRLDKLTNLGVNISIFAFVALQVPQIVKDFTEDPAKMKDLAWPGFVSGSMGNLLLATYFSGVPEWPAVRIQAIGAITNYFVATQVYMAGYFPAPQFWTLATVILIGLLIPLLYALGMMKSETFSAWQESTTAIGLAALMFSVTATFNQDNMILLAVALIGLAIGTLMLLLKNKVPVLRALTATLGGWLATLLFMWMPLPQLFKTIRVGKDAAMAFSIGFTILATIGNGLGATRALVIRERVWFVGSTWGVLVGGWVMAVAVWWVNPVEVPLWALIPYTAFLVIYCAVIVKFNGIAKQQSVFQQLKFLFFSTSDNKDSREVVLP